jgi:hypothetical protein
LPLGRICRADPGNRRLGLRRVVSWVLDQRLRGFSRQKLSSNSATGRDALGPHRWASVARQPAVERYSQTHLDRVWGTRIHEQKMHSCERVNCGALLASLTITPWPFSTPVTVADSEREATLGEAQWRAHQIACLFGEQAPAPMSGEDVLPYRKRLLRRYVPVRRASAHSGIWDTRGIAASGSHTRRNRRTTP